MLKFFLLFLVSFSAYGQGDLSGNLRSQFNNTRLNFGNLQVPNNQATKTGAINALIETGNKNILSNPGFEHTLASTGWTITGTASTSTETAAPLSGLKSFRADMTAQTFDLIQDQTIYAAARSGSQMFLRLVAKNTAPNCVMYLRKNGVKQTGSNDFLALATDGVTKTYELAFLANGTSNGIEVECTSTTGTLIVDDVELSTESASFVDVAQIGPWISYTPTITGFGVAATVEFQYRINGSSLDIRGRFTSGTPTAVEARVSLPTGFTSATSAVIPSLAVAGFGAFSVTGATSYYALMEPSVSYFTIGRSSSVDASFAKANGSALAGSGQALTFSLSIPVQGLSNKVSTYSQACTTDVQCENVFSAKVSAAGVVSGENLDWINGNCTAVSGTFTCTYNSNVFTETPNCSILTNAQSGTTSTFAAIVAASNTSLSVFQQTTGAAATLGFQLVCQKATADFKAKNVITGSFQNIEKCADPYECTDTFSAKVSATGVVSEENLDWINGNCTNATPRVCTFISGLVTTGMNCQVTAVGAGGRIGTIITSSSTAFSFQNDPSQYDSHILCQKQGVDFRPKTAVAGTFLDSVTSPGAGKVSLCSAKISATGVISDQIGGCFASCTNATTPVCTFTSNYWVSGSVPNCSVVGDPGDFNSGVTTTTTTMSGFLKNSAGSLIAGARIYVCQGLKQ